MNLERTRTGQGQTGLPWRSGFIKNFEGVQRLSFIILLIFLGCQGDSQTTEQVLESVKQLRFSPKHIYLFCRGTKGKSRLIATQFNWKDSNITHVGVGFAKKGRVLIYNVTDTRGLKDALVIDSLESFICTGDIYYFSIWSCSAGATYLRMLQKIIGNYTCKKIVFDNSFLLANDDTLYCSEFCATVLNKMERPGISFEPVKKQITDRLYLAILKRKELVYFPVDFFRANNLFKLVREYKIEK